MPIRLFINEPSDVQWLNETKLKGVILPSSWKDFQSFTLEGNEDAPHAVNLYKGSDPLYMDDFYRIRFTGNPPIFCECCEYDGKTQKPKGGLSPID